MSPSADHEDEFDPNLAVLLDELQAAQERGDQVAYDALVAEHPQLADFKDALEVLSRMGPDADFASQLFDALAIAEPEASEVFPDPSPDSGMAASTSYVGAELDNTIIVPKDEADATSQFDKATITADLEKTLPVATSNHQFGRYELLEELGRGGMGVVFRARQTDLNRTVALKMILVNRLASRDDIRRFYQEAQAAGRLSHPHIVGIHEVGEIHGQHFFSMDCIDGPSLSDVLQSGPAQAIPSGRLPDSDQGRIERKSRIGGSHDADGPTRSATAQKPVGVESLQRWEDRFAQSTDEESKAGPLSFDQVARVIRDVALAVDYLHGEGIIHRDLKPSNILLDESGHAYVTDFGLAKITTQDSEATHEGVIIGTPSYMSPEQAAGRQHEICPASDVYSLGAILYQCLAGRVPHRGPNAMQTLVQVIEAEPELP